MNTNDPKQPEDHDVVNLNADDLDVQSSLSLDQASLEDVAGGATAGVECCGELCPDFCGNYCVGYCHPLGGE